jgi:hypothetical protein
MWLSQDRLVDAMATVHQVLVGTSSLSSRNEARCDVDSIEVTMAADIVPFLDKVDDEG